MQQLALKLLTVESTYRLFVNGKEILDVGYPDSSAETTIAELKPVIIPVVAATAERLIKSLLLIVI